MNGITNEVFHNYAPLFDLPDNIALSISGPKKIVNNHSEQRLWTLTVDPIRKNVGLIGHTSSFLALTLRLRDALPSLPPLLVSLSSLPSLYLSHPFPLFIPPLPLPLSFLPFLYPSPLPSIVLFFMRSKFAYCHEREGGFRWGTEYHFLFVPVECGSIVFHSAPHSHESAALSKRFRDFYLDFLFIIHAIY